MERASFFHGIASDELEELLGRLPRRHFAEGDVVITEGDVLREMYVAHTGFADVLVADRHGGEHRVGRVLPGTAIGEISLLTGQPASGTVRAATEMEVVVLTRIDLERAAERFPRIYLNLGTTLAERLARTNRVSLRGSMGRLIVLHDSGAPPLLAYALACSVAWHTRGRTLLVAFGEDVPAELAPFATLEPDPVAARKRRPRAGAEVMVARPTDAFGADRLDQTIDDLLTSFESVLVLTREPAVLGDTGQLVTIAGAVSAESNGAVPATPSLVGWVSGDQPRPRYWPGIPVRVQEPGQGDTAALRDGLLPASSPAGRALGFAARHLTGLAVGLALGAGSIRGYAHCGVLRALERCGLAPDYLAGTSVGGCVAAMYAAGFTPDECAGHLDTGGGLLLRPALPTRSLLSSRSFRRFVRALGPEVVFDDLELPLAIVTADLPTGREIVLRRGLVWQAVVATMSIPGVFPAQSIGPYTLVDGGILNPVPLDVAERMGAGTVIGVRLVASAHDAEWEAESIISSGRPPYGLPALLRSIELMQSRIEVEPTDAARVLITPEYDGVASAKLLNFRSGRRFVEDGEAAVEAALPRLESAFPWLRPPAA